MEIDIKQFEDIEHHIIAVPFHGKLVLVKGRELSPLQIRAIGKFSLVKTGTKSTSSDWRQIASVFELQHKIVQAWLVSPSYDEIMKIAGLGEYAKETEKKIKEVALEIMNLHAGPQKKELEQELASLRMLSDLVLPNDFTSTITDYALKRNETDINLVTDEILLEAATLREIQGGRVSDYVPGNLSEFNKVDIDERGLMLYAEKTKVKKR